MHSNLCWWHTSLPGRPSCISSVPALNVLTHIVIQGWRLDPLLLFGQLLTAGAALSFGVEALRLREIVYKKEVTLASTLVSSLLPAGA